MLLLLLLLLHLIAAASSEQLYTLVITTGALGTNNRVVMDMKGLQGNSPQASLNEKEDGTIDRSMFQPGQTDTFSNVYSGSIGFVTELNLGQVSSTGSYQTWQVTRILIYSQNTRVEMNKTITITNSKSILFDIDGKWSSWFGWSACAGTCGKNIQIRRRLCNSPSPINNGATCAGSSKETQNCTHGVLCPVNGNWSSWSAWAACSSSCNGGIRNRTRRCDSPAPVGGGADCSGVSVESEICNQQQCPVNGNWGSWSEFSECNATCGRGHKSRSRICNSPAPAHGGIDCEGSGADVRLCDLPHCPIDGAWSNWSDWGSCSATCNNGTALRRRTCSNPLPMHGGSECVGEPVQSQECFLRYCPINGGWSSWSAWSSCSLSCNNGTETRQRACTNPAPRYGGSECGDEAKQRRNCFLRHCPINGGWSSWSAWSSCSVSCSNGTETRQRACKNPAPRYGGSECGGDNGERRNCFQKHCPIHGGWSQWSEFSNCSVSCGTGLRTRTRSCDSPQPQFGGRYCVACDANVTSSDGYYSVEDGCYYTDAYYRSEDETDVWEDDYQQVNCTMPTCVSDIADFTNSLVDSFLKNLNSNSSNKSDSESMKAAQQMVDKVAEKLMESVEVGKPVIVNTKSIAIGLAKVNASAIAGESMDSEEKGGVNLEEAQDLGLDGDETNLKFSALDPKLLFPGGDKKDLSAAVLSLKIATGNKEVKPKNSSKVSLTLKLPNQNKQKAEDLLEPVEFNSSKQMVQKLYFEAKSTAVKVSLELPQQGNSSYELLFLSAKPANFSKQANVSATITSNGTIQQQGDGTLTVRISIDKLLAASSRRRRRSTSASAAVHSLSIFIPGNQLPAGSSVFMSLQSLSNASSNLSLSVGVASITPRAWDDLLGGWVDAAADVAEASSIEGMVFKSNFFGSFSGKMFVAPNTINFATVFNNFGAKLAENFVTLLVLCLVIGIYVLVSVCMWRLDRREAQHLRYEPLADNEYDNDYTYVISVYTADESGAATTANVFVNLAGTWGSSGKRQLSDGERRNFTRGSVCNFAMTTRAPLGELRGVKVWHDGSGKQPRWFLEKILIEDLQTKKNFIFVCDQWLAEDKFDSRTMRVLPEIKQDARFQEMFLRYKAGGVMSKHVLTTLFRKTGQSSYTRLQRTGVANAMFFLTMVCNAMWFGKGDDLDAEANFNIDFGPISMTWFQLYSGILSMLITYPCIFAAAEIFRRTKKWKRRWSEDDMDSMKKELRLPKWFLLIGWGLLFTGVAASFFFTFLYSIEWGKEKANGWLKSFFLGIFQLVVVTDPVMLLVVFVVAKKLFGSKESEDNVFEIDDLINDEIKQVLDGSEQQPPDKARLEEIRAEQRNSQKLSSTFTDVLSYVVYMFLLVAIAYDSREQIGYLQNQNVKEQFLMKIPKLQNFGSVFDWLQRDLVPGIYRSHADNGEPLFGDLKNAIATCDCIRQGPFRLRQLRVTDRKCPITWPFSAYTKKLHHSWTCSGDYSDALADTGTYRPLWLRDTNGWIQNASAALRSQTQIKAQRPNEIVLQAFWHRSAEFTMSFPIHATFATYPAEGFTANLGLNHREAKWIIDRLRNTNWLDEHTRAVILEGTVYNANTNLFTTIQIVIEFPATGGIFTMSSTVRTYRLYNFVGGKGIVLMAMLALFMLICLYQIYREATSLWKLRGEYFDDIWNKIEFVNILICISIMISYGTRIKLTIDAIERRMNNRGFFVAFDNVIEWVEFTCIAMATSVFLTIFRVLKFLGFNRHIAILLATVKHCAMQLSSFGVAFGLILIAFMSAGILLFSFSEASFASALTTCKALFASALGIQTYLDIFPNTQGNASLIFYGGWSTLSVFFLVSVFVSILTDTYSVVVSDGLYDYDEEFVNHMWSRFMTLMKSVGDKTDAFKDNWQQKVTSMKKMVNADDIEIQLNEDGLQQQENGSCRSLRQINPGLQQKLAEVNSESKKQAAAAGGGSYSWKPKETGEEIFVEEGVLQAPVGGRDDTEQQEQIPKFKSNAVELAAAATGEISQRGDRRDLSDSSASVFSIGQADLQLRKQPAYDALNASGDSLHRFIAPALGFSGTKGKMQQTRNDNEARNYSEI